MRARSPNPVARFFILLLAVGGVGISAVAAIDFGNGRGGAGATATIVSVLCLLAALRFEVVSRGIAVRDDPALDASVEATTRESRASGFIWAAMVAGLGAGVGYAVGQDVTGTVVGALFGCVLGLAAGFGPIPREFLGKVDKPSTKAD